MKIIKDRVIENVHYATERVYDVLYKESIKSSVEYVRPFINDTVICDHGWWDISIQKMKTKGICLEFGVYKGESLKYFSKNVPSKKWYGFDSFLGLQEDWKGGYFIKGYFDLKGEVPAFDKNVKIIKGWFKDTLPIFFKKNKNLISFIHIDCDTYESTKDIFDSIKKERLQKGCIILFDEYLGYINWNNHEFKAWQEYVKKNNIKYKYIAFGERQAVIEII
jgi:hypothetical protein